MTVYYNEIDLYCADWLQNLMDAGHIAPGVIDTRSIEDVTPAELAGYTQCHFFAGIGVWSLALRASGWPDSRPAWTGSCPCQPFSAAGKGAGFDDERHLWPAWQHLIAQCRPSVVFGEQVASKAVDAWIDLVHADMEGMGYAFGGIAFPSAGVGAPHIRDRTFWVGDSVRERQPRPGIVERPLHPTSPQDREIDRTIHVGGRSGLVGLADSDSGQCDGFAIVRGHERNGKDAGRSQGIGSTAACGDVCGMADADGGIDSAISARADQRGLPQSDGCCAEEQHATGPTNGFWRSADWLGCTDGKWRPVEARVQQMADGHPLRVGPMCPVLGKKVEEVMNEAAKGLQKEADSMLREVRNCVGSEDIFGWRGGVFGVHEAQILLSYLLQYARKERGEPDAEDGPGPRLGAERDVRVLWKRGPSGDSPCQRGLDRWSLRELADSLRALSSAVARFASEAGYPNLYADAAASFPLGELLYPDSLGELRPKARAARLKGYGNAINAQAAQAFIESYCEARGLILAELQAVA